MLKLFFLLVIAMLNLLSYVTKSCKKIIILIILWVITNKLIYLTITQLDLSYFLVSSCKIHANPIFHYIELIVISSVNKFSTSHVSSANHLVGIFTKTLVRDHFLHFLNKFGFSSIHSSDWRGVLSMIHS